MKDGILKLFDFSSLMNSSFRFALFSFLSGVGNIESSSKKNCVLGVTSTLNAVDVLRVGVVLAIVSLKSVYFVEYDFRGVKTFNGSEGTDSVELVPGKLGKS